MNIQTQRTDGPQLVRNWVDDTRKFAHCPHAAPQLMCQQFTSQHKHEPTRASCVGPAFLSRLRSVFWVPERTPCAHGFHSCCPLRLIPATAAHDGPRPNLEARPHVSRSLNQPSCGPPQLSYRVYAQVLHRVLFSFQLFSILAHPDVAPHPGRNVRRCGISLRQNRHV